MSQAKEIRDRIDSIQNTLKITNAMYMIASTKMNAARNALERTEPYFYRLQGMFARVCRHLPEDFSHPYLDERKGLKEEAVRRAIICVTADKGLAGTYNHNVLKTAMEQVRPGSGDRLYVIGEYGRHYFERHHVPIEQAFQYGAQRPTLHRAREMAAAMLELFEQKRTDEVYIVYTNMVNSMESETRVQKLLPLEIPKTDPAARQAAAYQEDFELYPSASVLLDNIVPDFVTGFIYSALVESYCAENSARMQAMDAANKSGTQLLAQLSIRYNRVRQAQITQEITEIAAGAQARRRQMQAAAKRHARREAGEVQI